MFLAASRTPLLVPLGGATAQQQHSWLSSAFNPGLIALGVAGAAALVGLISWLSLWVMALGVSSKAVMAISLGLACLPLAWFVLWKQSKGSLVLVTIALILGDVAASVVAPALLAMTFPDCIRLLVHYRQHPIRWVLGPFLVLATLYVFSGSLLGFTHEALALTNGMIMNPGVPHLELGWAALGLGFVILYPLLYIPLLLLAVNEEHPGFFKGFLFGVSLLVNAIALGGVVEFIMAQLFMPGMPVRVASLMRLPTRLGPFLLVFIAAAVPLFYQALTAEPKNQASSVPALNSSGLGWLGSKLKPFLSKGWVAYWGLTLALNTWVLFLSGTRIAIAVLVLMLGLYALMLYTSGFKKLVKSLLLLSLVVGGLGLAGLVLSGSTVLDRFSGEELSKGTDDRDLIHEDWWQAAQLENTTPALTALHTLFGWGVFRERGMAHFNIHSTPLCVFACFGATGVLLYFSPYLLLAGYTTQRLLQSPNLHRKLLNTSALGIWMTFAATGLFHNKLYSPIETGYVWLLAGCLLLLDQQAQEQLAQPLPTQPLPTGVGSQWVAEAQAPVHPLLQRLRPKTHQPTLLGPKAFLPPSQGLGPQALKPEGR